MEENKNKSDFSINWKTIFMARSGGFSSKRICGVLGWFVCLSLLIAGFITEKQVPEFAELVAITSASLLGIDCVTSIWNKQIQQ